MLNINFECNICGTVYSPPDDNTRVPEGWGVMTPTLRVSLPKWAQSGDAHKKWREAQDLRENFKKQLVKRKYHICPICLKLNQAQILKIETDKKKN